LASPRFSPEQAAFLAIAATEQRLVTYGEFADRFGGIAQGWGAKLTEMGEWLKDQGLPLLPVLVVNKQTRLPSADANFYRRLGLDEEGLKREQQACFNFDWSTQPFWTEEK
tara:strand:+ start:13642 stop:13974 length:333 start_codon:yes stop_codon:yes gene_type:complete